MRTSEPRFRDSVISLSHTLTQLGLCVSVCPPARQLARAHGVRFAPPRVWRPQKKTYFAVWERFLEVRFGVMLSYMILCVK